MFFSFFLIEIMGVMRFNERIAPDEDITLRHEGLPVWHTNTCDVLHTADRFRQRESIPPARVAVSTEEDRHHTVNDQRRAKQEGEE